MVGLSAARVAQATVRRPAIDDSVGQRGWITSPSPIVTVRTPPKPRQVTGWIMRPDDKLTDEDTTELRRVLDRCATLRQVDQLVSNFAGMARHRQGQHLDAWITQAKSSNIPAITGFADGLLKDYDAVRNGLTLEHSSGAVEGHVNRIKMIKITMYGRANFDFLRRHVLLAE